MENMSLTFLKKGLTESENDYVHRVIERATKQAFAFTPGQWFIAVWTTRKSVSIQSERGDPSAIH